MMHSTMTNSAIRTHQNKHPVCVTLVVCCAMPLIAAYAQTAVIDLHQPNDRIWRINRPALEPDVFGGDARMAVGDIDGDGNHDLVVSLSIAQVDAPRGPWDFLEAPNSGAVQIFYGGAQRRGTETWPILGEATDDETQLLYRSEVLDWIGNPYSGYPRDWQRHHNSLTAAVACDDFDSDGYDDVAYTSCSYYLNDRVATQSVNIAYGGACMRGLGSTLSAASSCSGGTSISFPYEVYYQVLGICSGDFNADSVPDLAVTTIKRFGDMEIVILFGGASIRQTRRWSQPDDTNTTRVQCQLVPAPQGNFDSFFLPRIELRSADVNGDGIDDLIFSDPRTQPTGFEDDRRTFFAPGADGGNTFFYAFPGVVYVIYGSRDLPGAYIDLKTSSPASGESRIRGETLDGWFGLSLGVGDMNRDGCDDLLAGAIANSYFDWWLQDQICAPAYLFPGSEYKLGVPWGNGSMIDLDRMTYPPGWFGESRVFWDFPIVHDEGELQFGAFGVVDLGDLNGDGRDDMVMSLGTFNPLDLSRIEVYPTPEIVPGDAPYVPGVVPYGNIEPSVRLVNTGYPFDGLGVRNELLAHQDIDGDGNTDIIYSSVTDSCIYVVFGEGGAQTATTVERYTDGKTEMRGQGGRLSPVLKTYIGFDDGSAGAVTTSLIRSTDGITGVSSEYSGWAGNYRLITIDRQAFSNAHIAIRYVDADFPGWLDDALVLLTAPSLSGPWTPIANLTHYPETNRIEATVSQFGYYLLAHDETLYYQRGPVVKDIRCSETPSPPGSDRLVVEFSYPVTGVDISDFAVYAPSGEESTILEMNGSGTTYTFWVMLGRGVGPARFQVLDDDSIRDQSNRPLGGPGEGNGAMDHLTCAEAFDPVLVQSIERDYPSPTVAQHVSYTVTFTAPVVGVDLDDFALDTLALQNAYVENIEGSGTKYRVWVYTGTGSGTLLLKLVDNDTITDRGGGPLAGPGHNNGDFQGYAYAILHDEFDYIPPWVKKISRASVEPTADEFVEYYVVFSEEVIGVNRSDFEIITGGGITGAAITGMRGSTLVQVVTVSTGTGDGTIQLKLSDDDSIVDAAGNPLGGIGVHNGNSIGPVFHVYKSAPNNDPPEVESIVRLNADPADAFTLRFRVRFTKPVTDVGFDDFATSVAGLLGSAVKKVTGSGDDYTVTVKTGNGAGTLRLDVRDNDSIFDAQRNPLGGPGRTDYTGGETYHIVREPALQVESLSAEQAANVATGSGVKIHWTSGAVGKKVRVELWRNGQKIATLANKTKNDGAQRVTIPGGVLLGGGYTIRVTALKDTNIYGEMRKTFTIKSPQPHYTQ